ncbi:MAG: DMT family transporter [Alphaproteobacteria bacterium]
MIQRLWNMPQLLMVATTSFWAGNTILGRAFGDVMPPIALAFWRWTLASFILLLIFHPALRRDWPEIKAHWKALVLLSFLGVGCYNTLVYVALQETTTLNALLVMSAMPALIVFVSRLLFGDRPSGLQILGGVISTIGAGVIVLRGQLSISLNPGDMIVMLAALCWAFYTSCLRLRPKTVSAAGFVTFTFALGPILLAPFYAWESLVIGRVVPFHDWQVLAVIGYVGIFPSILAYFCFNRGVELMGAGRAGQYIHLLPLIGSALAIWLLGEELKSYHLIGAVLIISGLIAAERAKHT